MKRVAGLVVLVVLTGTGTASAQLASPAPEFIPVGDWKLAPVVEARVRGEGRHDLDGLDHGTLVERVRLGADASRGPLEVRVVLQDARLWGLGDGSTAWGQPGPFAQTGAYEAWVEAHTASAHPSFVRLGRQAVTWGEGRLLGESDWSPTGRTLDAVRGRLEVGDWSFEALGASLSDPDYVAGSPVPSAYGELVGARVEWALDPLFATELYGLGRFAQANPINNLEGSVKGETYTASLRLHGDAHAITWGAEGALQLGHADALLLDRLAGAGAGHVAYTFEHVLLRPGVRLGGSYATGTSGGNKLATFDPHPTRRAHVVRRDGPLRLVEPHRGQCPRLHRAVDGRRGRGGVPVRDARAGGRGVADRLPRHPRAGQQRLAGRARARDRRHAPLVPLGAAGARRGLLGASCWATGRRRC